MKTSPLPAIFVSYASEDRDFVLPIVDRLKAHGLDIWLDSQRLSGGMNWAQEIVRALKRSQVLILICSQAALRSRAVAQEIQLAWKYELRYLPIFLQPLELSERLEFFLEGTQWIDAQNRPLDDWIPQLLAALDAFHPPTTALFAPAEQSTAKASLEQLRSIATFTDRIWPLVVDRVEETAQKREYLVRHLGPSREAAPIQIALGSRVFWAIDWEDPAYLLLLDEGPEGQVYCLCPSWFCPTSQIEPGLTLLPPREANCEPFVVTGEPGREHILAILSQSPLAEHWMPESPKTPARILSPTDLKELTEYLQLAEPGMWTALATSVEITV